MLQLIFLQEYNAQAFIQVSIGNIPSVKQYCLEKSVVLCLASQSLKSENLENAIVIDLSRYSNRLFSSTTGLSSSIKIFIESLTLVEVDSIEKPLILILATKSCYSKLSGKI